jgi:hypothetical protein
MSNLVFARCEAAGFTALSQAEQTIYCLDALEREVNNGGFSQFFLNSSGDTALAAREKQMDALPESAQALWSELDGAFCEYRDNLAALERAYVSARRAEFK